MTEGRSPGRTQLAPVPVEPSCSVSSRARGEETPVGFAAQGRRPQRHPSAIAVRPRPLAGVVGIFPNREAIIRLVGAMLAEQPDERYMGTQLLATAPR